jgi:lipid-A-disaccharide synthase
LSAEKNNILIVAGEASADLHGANVVAALRRMNPAIKVRAMGGDHLRRAGAEILVDSSRLAVVGITEVLGRLGDLIRAYRNLKRVVQNGETGLLVLIDFPDFNLRLAGVAREAGVPVLYYISPQVWAWRSGRTKMIAGRVDRMAVIFPFEAPLYREAGLEAEFVGHPLMDTLGMPGDLPLSLAKNGWRGDPLIALLPGSRHKEVKFLLPEMIRAAQIISGKKSGAKFLLALAPSIHPEEVKDLLPPQDTRIQVVEGRTYEVLRAADLALVASGTATLETAILGKPMVIVYRVSPLSYWVARAMVKVKWIGLVNLVAGRALVPELIQAKAKGEQIALEALRILEDGSYREEMVRGLAGVRERLGSPGAAERVARMAIEMMKRQIPSLKSQTNSDDRN